MWLFRIISALLVHRGYAGSAINGPLALRLQKFYESSNGYAVMVCVCVCVHVSVTVFLGPVIFFMCVATGYRAIQFMKASQTGDANNQITPRGGGSRSEQELPCPNSVTCIHTNSSGISQDLFFWQACEITFTVAAQLSFSPCSLTQRTLHQVWMAPLQTTRSL